MKTLIPSVKGARDFYPEEKAIHTWLYNQIRLISGRFGYLEYEAPFLEKIELYAAKSGEELVKEQAFVLQDRGGELLTLRPELTPSLARMIAQRQNLLTYPLRWWSFGPFWRYERPQKGRSREFFQWNIDLIGVNTPEADAELIAICVEFMRLVGLTHEMVGIRVNDRRLMDELLINIGINGEQKKAVFKVIDHSDKMTNSEWEQYATDLGINKKQLDGLKQILNDENLWQKSTDMKRLFATLKALGVDEFVRFDAHIIRGLDYYTGTVFEANDLDGGRALLGGGHYDNLVEAVGGEPLPAVGFAMGDVMITLVLQKYGLLPELPQYQNTCLVTVFDENSLDSSYRLAAQLRADGINTICYSSAAKLLKQLKFADKLGIRYVILQGTEEIEQGTIAIKDLKTHQQQTMPEAQFSETLKKMMSED